MKPTIICLPTYNERENLSNMIEAIHGVVPHAHILVIDDNSPDGTGQIADERAAADERVHVLHRAAKEGLGRAYIAGFVWALARDYELIFQMDCDFSHQPKYLVDFSRLAQSKDLVLGSRYIPGGGTEGWAWHRRLLSKGGNVYAQLILGLPQRDLTGGFKCWNRRVLEALPLGEIQSNGYVFQIEMTYRVVRQGFSIGEVPIVFPDRVAGESKMTGGIVTEAMTNVIKIRLNA
jgi:dolichol-phosphate mannosyltransferase